MTIALHSYASLCKYHYMYCHWFVYLFEDAVSFNM